MHNNPQVFVQWAYCLKNLLTVKKPLVFAINTCCAVIRTQKGKITVFCIIFVFVRIICLCISVAQTILFQFTNNSAFL